MINNIIGSIFGSPKKKELFEALARQQLVKKARSEKLETKQEMLDDVAEAKGIIKDLATRIKKREQKIRALERVCQKSRQQVLTEWDNEGYDYRWVMSSIVAVFGIQSFERRLYYNAYEQNREISSHRTEVSALYALNNKLAGLNKEVDKLNEELKRNQEKISDLQLILGLDISDDCSEEEDIIRQQEMLLNQFNPEHRKDNNADVIKQQEAMLNQFNKQHQEEQDRKLAEQLAADEQKLAKEEQERQDLEFAKQLAAEEGLVDDMPMPSAPDYDDVKYNPYNW